MPAQPAWFHRLDEILDIGCGASTPDTSIGKRVERLLKGTRAPRTDAPFRRRSGHTPPGGHRRSRFVCDQVGRSDCKQLQ